MRTAIVIVSLLLLARCSCDEAAPDDDGGEGDEGEGEGDEGEGEGDEGEGDEGEGDEGEGEDVVDGSVVDISLFVDDTCVVTATPASIAVAPGTGFYARFTNLASSDIETNIDKIDRFNQVPLVIDLAPGEVFDDDIRRWCGIERGTFSFRFDPCGGSVFTFLDVDCDNTD